MQYEKRCLTFGASLFCSDKDRKTVADGSRGTNAFVVPNIYHNGAFGNYDFGDGFCNLNVLLFVGGLMYRPNIEGITWFVKSIFREFRTEHPEAKLLLVGHSPAREIHDLCAGNEGIELHADMPDINSYYRQCGAVVVPLLTGGGTRIKILEAALAGRPVLSTPMGAEGLDLADGTDLLLFKDTGEFMDRYRELLDRHTYDRMVCSAKDSVSSEYSRDRFHGIMEEVIGDIDRRKRQTACVQ